MPARQLFRMKTTRTAAVTTWIYTAGFGLPVLPVAVYLRRRGTLPTFLGLFEMYGGPWSLRYTHGTFIVLLVVFLVVTVVVAWAAWLMWQGSRTGAVLSLVLMPVEAVFWTGFALPIPWVAGVARVGLVLLGWQSLERRASHRRGLAALHRLGG